MRQWQRQILKHEKGFTLIEALFQLVVFALFAQLAIGFFLLIQHWNESFFTEESIEWEIFIQDFQQYLLEIDEIYQKGNSLYIVESPTEIIKIDKISDVLRLQINNQGYVPLLIGIQNVEFSIAEPFLKVKVKFLNGIVKERELYIQYAQE